MSKFTSVEILRSKNSESYIKDLNYIIEEIDNLLNIAASEGYDTVEYYKLKQYSTKMYLDKLTDTIILKLRECGFNVETTESLVSNDDDNDYIYNILRIDWKESK